MKLTDICETYITEEELWEMINISPEDSGINCVMFVSTKQYVNGKHGPRIKISNLPNKFSSNDNFVITISKKPELIAGKCNFDKSTLNNLFKWTILNYEPLMKFWNAEYSSTRYFYMEIKNINEK